MNYEVALNETDLSFFPLDKKKLQSGLDFIQQGFLGNVFDLTTFKKDSILTCFGLNCNQKDIGSIIASKYQSLNIDPNESFIFAVLDISNIDSIGVGNKITVRNYTYNFDYTDVEAVDFIIYCGDTNANNILNFKTTFNMFINFRGLFSTSDPIINDTAKIEGVCFIGKLN